MSPSEHDSLDPKCEHLIRLLPLEKSGEITVAMPSPRNQPTGSENNPYSMPETVVEVSPPERLPWRVWFATLSLLGIGSCFLLLPNDQPFTNACVFLACALASCSIWIRLAFQGKGMRAGQLAIFFCALHVLLVAVVVTGLPALYANQQRLNSGRAVELPR